MAGLADVGRRDGPAAAGGFPLERDKVGWPLARGSGRPGAAPLKPVLQPFEGESARLPYDQLAIERCGLRQLCGFMARALRIDRYQPTVTSSCRYGAPTYA